MKKYFFILLLAGCARSEFETQLSNDAYQQIERLGRPAVNEGLVVSNDLLNAYNMIMPSLDLSAKAAPVLKEAGGVLQALYDYGNKNGLNPPQPSAVVAALIPDVMRIDTRAQVGIGKWAYNAGAFNTGRKIED